MSLIVKGFLKSIGTILGLLFIFSLVINVLYYFDIISNNLVKYIKMFFSVLSFFIGGLSIGKKSTNKGYINGLKLSIIIILLFFVLSIILNNLNISHLIYYLITMICITFGAMIGISKKES